MLGPASRGKGSWALICSIWNIFWEKMDLHDCNMWPRVFYHFFYARTIACNNDCIKNTTAAYFKFARRTSLPIEKRAYRTWTPSIKDDSILQLKISSKETAKSIKWVEINHLLFITLVCALGTSLLVWNWQVILQFNRDTIDVTLAKGIGCSNVKFQEETL